MTVNEFIINEYLSAKEFENYNKMSEQNQKKYIAGFVTKFIKELNSSGLYDIENKKYLRLNAHRKVFV
jgi:hypothetical protein